MIIQCTRGEWGLTVFDRYPGHRKLFSVKRADCELDHKKKKARGPQIMQSDKRRPDEVAAARHSSLIKTSLLSPIFVRV